MKMPFTEVLGPGKGRELSVQLWVLASQWFSAHLLPITYKVNSCFQHACNLV